MNRGRLCGKCMCIGVMLDRKSALSELRHVKEALSTFFPFLQAYNYFRIPLLLLFLC